MRFLTAFSTICAAIAGSSSSSVSVKDCTPGSPFRISAVDFLPMDPVSGQNGTLHTVYDVPTPVVSGSSRYSCTLNGLPVYDETFDLCSQTACPITAGTHDDYSISAVPTTSGKVSCKINWSNQAGAPLMCVQITLTLAPKTLRGVYAIYTPPTYFHSHVFPVPQQAMCNITEYDNLRLRYKLISVETEQTDMSSSSSSGMGNNTSSSSSSRTSTGGSSAASEMRMKALVVRLRDPATHPH